jgi:four helix bundle protein
MQSTDNLVVARYARKLAVLTYEVTAHFPRSEQFGITAQMRRAALSIGSNIAEGCGRSTKKQFIHSLDQAAGEASELEYQCVVAADMKFGRAGDVEHLRAETIRVKKMLARLMAFLRTQPPKRQKGNSRREFPLDQTDKPTNRSD